jgi:CRISPR/Cas system CSM-associated protein Csm3 (group 7 of RAMP superfamily)
MHIGALSPTNTSAGRGMLKDDQGWPYIPASHFKGRLRHAIERIARGFDLYVCDTHRRMCRDKQNSCPVCSIFGAPWIPGSVRFEDLTLSGPDHLAQQREEGRAPSTVQRHGVGLSRKRKVTEDALLFTTELFQPGVPLEFSGPIQGATTQEQAAWLFAGIRYLESVGSDRTRGLGWVVGETTVSTEEGEELSAEALQQVLEKIVRSAEASHE